MTILLTIAALGLAGCAGEAADAGEQDTPAKVEKIAGTDKKRLTLRADAVKRLGLTTEPIADGASSTAAVQAFGAPFLAGKTTMPYGALLYAPSGETFAYTSPAPLTFTREAVTVASIKAGIVVLSSGPPVGTLVVAIGTAELHGLESGVGK